MEPNPVGSGPDPEPVGAANRSRIAWFQERMMTGSKWLAAALVSAVLGGAPIAAEAADYALRRHHHRHHHHVHRYHIQMFSYLHNYGPGPLPGTYAYYDGPTSVRC